MGFSMTMTWPSWTVEKFEVVDDEISDVQLQVFFCEKWVVLGPG